MPGTVDSYRSLLAETPARLELVSACQRLMPLGQTDGQSAIMALKPVVLATAQRAGSLPEGDPFPFLGSATFVADLASMWHETQYTRLFRS